MAVDLKEARQARTARNQSLFRDVNESLEEAMRALPPRTQDFLCECANRECNEMVSLSISEYELVRSVPTHFAIVSGHEVAEVERVVTHADGRYTVVETIEKAAELARILDPRRVTLPARALRGDG